MALFFTFQNRRGNLVDMPAPLADGQLYFSEDTSELYIGTATATNLKLSGVFPSSIAPIAHEWLTGYTASTGLFTQSQPAFTDISGRASSGQVPTDVAYVDVVQSFTSAQTFSAALTVSSTLKDGTNAVGTSGQVLSSTATGVLWVTGATAVAFQVNATPTTSQTTINFQNGSHIAVTNPSAGNVAIAFSGQLANTIAAVSSQWLRSYDSSTGNFTASQPAFTDISGRATSSQVPTDVAYVDVIQSFTVAQTFSGQLVVSGALKDGAGSVGGSGNVLTSTVTGVAWVSVAAGAAFQVNATPTTSQTTINFQNGTGITVSNPSAGNVQFALSSALPANTPGVAHNFITAYNSTTGAFTQAQPAYSDISGTVPAVTSVATAGIATGGPITTTGTITVAGSGTTTTAATATTNVATAVTGHVITSDGSGNVQDSGTALVSKANTASPTFTGTVTIPSLRLTGTFADGANSVGSSGNLLSSTATATAWIAQSSLVIAYSQLTGAPSSLPPSGTAGGDLSGTYPNPTVAQVNGAAVPASKTIVGTNSSSQIIDATAATLANNTTGTSGGLSGTPSIIVNVLTATTINGAAFSGTFTGAPTFSGNIAFTGTPTFVATTQSGSDSHQQTTAATSGANQNSPLILVGGTVWNGAASVNDQWTFSDTVGTGTNGTSTLTLNHLNTGSTGTAAVSIPQSIAATVSVNQSGPQLILGGTVWNGSVSVNDTWTVQNVIGAGTNGTSTLTFSHSGSTGTAAVSLPILTVTTVSGNPTFSGTPVFSNVPTLPSQSANLFFASPNGSSGAPTFRAIVAADVPTLNQNTTGSAAKWTTARNLAGNSVDGSANVAFANAFIVQGTTDAGLTGAQFLGALGTGIVKNTTTTGVLSIAIAADFPTLNQNTTGTAGGLTGTPSITVNALTATTINGAALSGTFTGGATFSGALTFSGTPTFTNTVTMLVGSKLVLEDPVDTTKKFGFNAGSISTGTTVTVNIPNSANSTPVIAASGAAHQFLTAVSSGGVLTYTQPAFSDISGNINVAQMNSGTGASSSTFWRGDSTWATPAGGGTVSSVDMTVPTFLSVSGNPITGSGTLAVTLATQTANTVFAGPVSGGVTVPTFRAVVVADIPTLNQNTTGTSGGLTGTPSITINALTATTINGAAFSGTFTGAPTFSGNIAFTGTPTFLATSQSGNDSHQQLTAATSGANQNSPLLVVGGTVWSGSVSVNDQWTFSDTVGTGTNGTSTLTLSHAGSTGAATVSIPQTIAATVSVNQNSPLLSIGGTVWNGSVSITDQWTIQDVIGAGSNGTSTLTFAHSGSSGTASVSIPVLTVTTLTLPSQTANTFFAAPSGSSGAPTFRAIVALDVPTLNQNTTGSAAKWTTARNLAGNSVDGSADVAFANKFIVQGTTDAGLSAAQFLGALATGIVKNTTTTGVLSIAIAADFPTLNQNTTGSAASFTGAVVGDVTGTQGATSVVKVNGASLPVSKTVVGTNSSGQIIDATATTLPTAMFPALTGDVTNTVGTLATTVGKVNGATIPLTKTIVGTNGSGQFIDATASTLANNTTGTSGGLTGTPSITVNALSATTINGAAFSGTFTGVPTFSGNISFTGTPTFVATTQSGTFTLQQTTAATVSVNQNSPSEVIGGTVWNGSISVNDQWTIQDLIGSGANGTSTLSLSHAGSTGAATVSIPQTTAATVSVNQNSPLLAVSGTVWNGSISIADQWTVQDVVGSGTNGTSTLTFAHSGSSGAASLSIPIISNNISFSGTPVFSNVPTLPSQSASLFFASPSGGSGVPSFRAVVSGDIPTLNQNTTGTSGGLTGTPSITVNALTATTINGAALSGTFTGAATFSGNINLTGTPVFSNVPTLPAQTTNLFFAAPNGSTGVPTFRAVVAADIPTLNQNTTGSAAKWTTARNLAGNSVDGSGNVAFANTFIVQGTTDAGLSGAQFLGALGTGIVKNTTTTGVLSIAIAADFPTLNQNTSGTAANLSGTPALPNGTTATTQTVGDNTTKLATTAFVLANAGGGSSAFSALTGSTNTTAAMIVGTGASLTVSGTGSITATALTGSPSITVNALSSTTINGAALSGTFTGAPTLSGNVNFSGTPVFAATTQSGNDTLQQTTAATGGANQNSPSLVVGGTVWNGSISVNDQWTIQTVVGAGTNGTSTLTFTHSGSSGAASLSIPIISNNLTFSGTPVFSNVPTFPSTTANFFFATPSGSSGSPSMRAIVALDVPTLNQNTSGTAANLSGTPTLPNGTTATTQTALDNSTKLATTAYANLAVGVENTRALAAEALLAPLASPTFTGTLKLPTVSGNSYLTAAAAVSIGSSGATNAALGDGTNAHVISQMLFKGGLSFAGTGNATALATILSTPTVSSGTTTLVANQLVVGSVVEFHAKGHCVIGTAGTITMQMFLGGVALWTATSASLATGITSWELDGYYYCTATGASGTAAVRTFALGKFLGGASAGQLSGVVVNTTTGFATTGTLALDIQAKFGTTSATNTIVCDYCEFILC